MGYLWGIFDRKPEHGTIGYFPCAPGCRASERDPRYCTCVCRGLNHGILIYGRPERPIPVPSGYDPRYPIAQEPEIPALPVEVPRLPEIRPKIQPNPFDAKVGRATKSIGRKIGHSLKVSIAGYSQDDLNSMVLNGLRKQFSEERANSFITEAFSEYFSHQPDANTPELYELYENGDLDRVLDRRSIRWVIGRPKIKR
jgi:hypothetical protein